MASGESSLGKEQEAFRQKLAAERQFSRVNCGSREDLEAVKSGTSETAPFERVTRYSATARMGRLGAAFVNAQDPSWETQLLENGDIGAVKRVGR
jgi:hypothetical protein